MTARKTLFLRCDPDVHERLTSAATAAGVSLNAFACGILATTTATLSNRIRHLNRRDQIDAAARLLITQTVIADDLAEFVDTLDGWRSAYFTTGLIATLTASPYAGPIAAALIDSVVLNLAERLGGDLPNHRHRAGVCYEQIVHKVLPIERVVDAIADNNGLASAYVAAELVRMLRQRDVDVACTVALFDALEENARQHAARLAADCDEMPTRFARNARNEQRGTL